MKLPPDTTDLFIRLSHELGVALELSYDPVELRELWPEALEAIRDVQALLAGVGLPAPPSAENVLRLAAG